MREGVVEGLIDVRERHTAGKAFENQRNSQTRAANRELTA